MLASFLESLDSKYKIEFRTDVYTHSLIVGVTREQLRVEGYISFELLTDEYYIVAAIREAIEKLEDAYE